MGRSLPGLTLVAQATKPPSLGIFVRCYNFARTDLVPSTALTLDDVPVTMLLAVFDSPIAAQIHLGV